MGSLISKRDVKDFGEILTLVTENVASIEPGLKIIDSHLRLGHATIDLVAVDSKESLVLIALGLTADDGMLLRALDAYSWCIEYPETVQRLYPTIRIQTGQPPRVLFIAGSMPEAFIRKIKQLAFTEVDCLTCGCAVYFDVYFDAVERIRRTPGHGAPVDYPRGDADTSPARINPSEAADASAARPNGSSVQKGNLAEAQAPMVAAEPPVSGTASPVAARSEWGEFLAQLGPEVPVDSVIRSNGNGSSGSDPRKRQPVEPATPLVTEQPPAPAAPPKAGFDDLLARLEPEVPAAGAARPNGNGDHEATLVEATGPVVAAQPSATPGAGAAPHRSEWEEFLARYQGEPAGEAARALADAAQVEPDPVVVTPPVQSVARLQEARPVNVPAPAQPKLEWQEFVTPLETQPPVQAKADTPATPVVEPEPPDATEALQSVDQPPEAAPADEGFEQQKEAWQELLNQVGTLHLPKDGELSREWREFLNQLGATE